MARVTCFGLRWLVILLLAKELQTCFAWSWIVAGSVDPSAPPPCQAYCVNVPQNRVNIWIGIFACEGTIYPNEQWSYDNITQSIASMVEPANAYCLDVNTSGSVIISDCNSASLTQKWTFTENNSVQNEGTALYMYASKNSSVIPGVYPLYVGNDRDVIRNSGASKFTLVEKSVLNTFVPPPPETNSSNFILNSYLQSTHTAALGVTLPPPVQYTDKRELLFYICNWSTGGQLTYTASTLEVHPPIPCYSNFTMVNLNTDDHLTSTAENQGSLMQVVPTYGGVSYDLSVTVGRNATSCPSSGAGSVEISVHVSSMNSSVDEDFRVQQNFSMSPGVETSWENFQITFTAPHGADGVAVTISSLTNTAGCGPFIARVEMFPSVAVSDSRSTAIPTIAAIIGWLIAAAGGLGVLWMCFVIRKKQRKFGRFHSDYIFSKKLQGLNYSFEEISLFTNNFTVLIGEGGFGKVYKGALPDGTEIAVKREHRAITGMRGESKDGLQSWGEVTMLGRVHHRCVVEFLGYCLDKGERLLISEYMPNGSLYDRLHRKDDRFAVLSWSQRVRIALQVACGLEYLHHGANPPIIHRDIKSANILIAHDLSAKLADLGVSKVGSVDASRIATTRTDVKGSLGYIDPQYFETSIISEKSDVYSYGVVLLELITGRKALEDCVTLAKWAQPFMEGEGAVEQMVDGSIAMQAQLDEVKELLEIARGCLKIEVQARPAMVDLVQRLQRLQATTQNYAVRTSFSDALSIKRSESDASPLKRSWEADNVAIAWPYSGSTSW